MNILWLGHGSFRLEIEDQVLLIDPWLHDNPMLPDTLHAAAIAGATQIIVTHAHSDHFGDVPALAKSLNVPVIGMYELMMHLREHHAVEVVGFNKGGTVRVGRVEISMVPASHSSTLSTPNGPLYLGDEVGYMIQGEGHCIYVSGDTGIMADMDWMGDYYDPDIGLLCAGGHFTMDMAGAAYAARRYFNFKTVIPCHYGTFGLIDVSTQPLIDGLPDVEVIEPQVMVAIPL